jgi:uncharacterized protein (TIGR03067 family)
MIMTRVPVIVVSCLAVLGFASGSPIFADKPKVDVASPLHGKWQVISIERSGVAKPENEIKNLQMVFAKDSIKIVRDGKDDGEPIKYSHDPSKTPRHIELTTKSKVVTVEPGQKPKTETRIEQIKGLYELNGDTLTVCLTSISGLARPESLSPKDREYIEIIVLKRVK